MCFTVQLSMFVYQASAKQIHELHLLVLSQTALIFYHVVFCLSRTFLTFFQVCFFLTFSSRSNFDILSLLFSDVKDFFQLFSKLFCVLTGFPDATLTSYHRFLCLSTGFFIFYIIHQKKKVFQDPIFIILRGVRRPFSCIALNQHLTESKIKV